MPEAVDIEVSYTPQSVVLAYRAMMTSDMEKNVLRIKGIYHQVGTQNYGGYYYDKLKEESSDFSLTLLTPSLLRTKLKPNSLIEFFGIISTKVSRYAGGIELQINLTDLVEQRQSQFTEEDEKRVELLNKKIALGYRDIDAFIKKCVFDKRRMSVKILVSKTGTPERDIRTALGTGITFYDFTFETISMGNATELANQIVSSDGEADMLCVARGGGDSVVLFDKPDFAECAFQVKKSFLLAAVGHDDDTPLFEKVSDKRFATPTSLGNYFREVYNNTVAEFENSKAKLIHDVSEQLRVKYELQIKVLIDGKAEQEKLFGDKEKVLTSQVTQLLNDKTKLEGTVQQNTNEIRQLNEKTQALYQQISQKSNQTSTIIISLIIGIVIGLILFAIFS